MYLVEASAPLRETQKQLLCGDADMRETKNGFQCTSKYSKEMNITWCEDVRFVPQGEPLDTMVVIIADVWQMQSKRLLSLLMSFSMRFLSMSFSQLLQIPQFHQAPFPRPGPLCPLERPDMLKNRSGVN